MGNFGDCASLLTASLSTANIKYFNGVCDALEIFRDYEDMLTLLEYVRDNKEGKFPAASRQALSNKIAFYAQFQAADNE